jgi:hypothetical protein
LSGKNFSGQPIFNQLIKFIDKSEIKKIAKKHDAERYVKKFTTYNQMVSLYEPDNTTCSPEVSNPIVIN